MLEERIQQDYVLAMKSRDTLKSSTLSFLRANLKNVFIEKKGQKLTDQDIIAVIKRQVKQRQDSITQYTQGGRQDLADKETAELVILKSYLPEEMSEQQLNDFVKAAITETGAGSMKDMGAVMKAMADKVRGRADNKLVSELVKRALAQM